MNRPRSKSRTNPNFSKFQTGASQLDVPMVPFLGKVLTIPDRMVKRQGQNL